MYEVFTRLCATAEVGAVVLDDFRVASGFERCQAFYTAAFQLGIDPLSFDIGLDGIGVVEPIDSDDCTFTRLDVFLVPIGFFFDSSLLVALLDRAQRSPQSVDFFQDGTDGFFHGLG